MSGPFRFQARVSGADPSPVRWATAFLVFVLLAVAKPWGQPRSAVGSGRPDDPRALTVAPGASSSRSSPDPSSAMADAVADVSELCPDPGPWRTATREMWQGQTVGVWRAIDPRPAGRPLDPAIPVVPAVGTSVPAIGYCAPTSGPEQPVGPAAIQAWRVDGDTVQGLELRQVAPAAGASPYGALFGPPAELGSTSSWPNGRVVFRYEELATGDSRWFAIEVSGTGG